MEDNHVYRIRVLGQVEEAELADFGPPGLAIQPDGPGITILTLRTDQSGLVGLIRSLHGRGYQLLSFCAA